MIASAFVWWRLHRRWRMWDGIMLVGVFSGGLFLLEPGWSLSHFIRDLGSAMVTGNSPPQPSRMLILVVMVLGLTAGARGMNLSFLLQIGRKN